MSKTLWPCVVCNKTGRDPEAAGAPNAPPCPGCDGQGHYAASDIAAGLLQDIFRAKADKPVQPEAVLDLLVRTVKLIQVQGKDAGGAYCGLAERLDDHGDRLNALDGKGD